MRDRFGNNKHAAYAYLLFILVYFPCIAALGAIIRELGRFYGWLCIVYLTVLAWITATLYYQIAYAHKALWIAVPVVLFLCMIALFNVIRNKTDPVGTR
jgi:ferrous iron transport protein B